MPLLLKRQLEAYKAQDPNEKKQKAIPVSVIHKITQLFLTSKDPLSVACSQLIVGAFFFAMRSCKYSKTTSPNESTTTKLHTLQNIHFFKNSELLPHNHSDLQNADIMSITFKAQKKQTKFHTISLHKSSATLCPVSLTWALIVQHICSYPSTNDATKVNAYKSSAGRLLFISSSQIRQKLRTAVSLLGK